MKGLKKIALATTIAAVSVGAQAELKALDDAAMGELTGQKGLTIDIETKWSIGEFAYVDAGVVVLKDLAMGGNSNDLNVLGVATNADGLLDNVRLTLDVAGAGATPGDNIGAYGMSEVKGLAAVHASKAPTDIAEFGAAAAGVDYFNTGNFSTDGVGGLKIDNEKVAGDGDLMLHFGFTDAWAKVGGYAALDNGFGVNVYTGADATAGTNFTDITYAEARDIASRSVDFQFDIGQIALAESSYADVAANGSSVRLGNEAIAKTNHTTGADDDGNLATTTLISDFSMKGFLGPMDIRIENDGNGFGADGSGVLGQAGSGNADSIIEWDSFFKVTDLDLYIDIAGVSLQDIKIHNERGDLSSLNTVSYDDGTGTIVTENTSALGFAHSKRDIFAVKDSVLNLHLGGMQDGIAINTEFKGDIDIGHLSFGDTGVSIGEIYLTDIESTTNWTISAH